MAILEVQNLKFRYSKDYIINDISFSVEKGDILGLVGENGSGKTTLMKIISGIFPNSEGKIVKNFSELGVLIENPSLYNDRTVKQNITFFCKLYEKGYKDISQYQHLLGVDNYLKKKVSKLSLGMRQRVGLLIALIASNEFILLDEPTNGLDPRGIKELLSLIKVLASDFGITFIVSSHILQNLDQICNNYIILESGKLRQNVSSEAEYKIYIPDISVVSLLSLLKEKKVDYTYTDAGDVIVEKTDEIERICQERNLIFKKRKLNLSEVYFDDKK
ncbi:ATP-binding cassette domain-containing protein [Lactococcus hircilactis]|uniref:ATP-binding cassette domain-containing protein n=1 Tax=Lactococcus hircilactis TaxID=1494462 RepID=A0A7X2D0G2_9LACT|nr:ABC transporter ATP-binding protein [Lactococcus hircilactis]MQW38347.1 ATP-binding cassette domain-containing protein [Lactococcus hircilactis]